jgi:hypothetical protein
LLFYPGEEIKEVVMAKEEIKGRKQVSASAAFIGGLMIAVLSFTAGAVGAGSHKVGEVSSTVSAGRTYGEVGAVQRVPSDQGSMQRVPGHSECDLQLD